MKETNQTNKQTKTVVGRGSVIVESELTVIVMEVTKGTMQDGNKIKLGEEGHCRWH